MEKWEYAHWFEAHTDLLAKPQLFKMMPDAFGRDGWELVSVVEWPAIGTGVSGLLYYFKRPVPKPLLSRILATLTPNVSEYAPPKTKEP